MKSVAPVALFVYNRADHMSEVLSALARCRLASETEVTVFSDGPKNEKQIKAVADVRCFLNSFDGSCFASFKTMLSDKNKGLARSIISGVTDIIEKYGRIIVIEDDSVPTVNFLEYMNACLDEYENDTNVWAIGGYLVPVELPSDFTEDVYLAYRGSSCAWGCWRDRWEKVDWDCKMYPRFKHSLKLRRAFNRGGDDMATMLDRQMIGKIDSWAIRFAYARFENNAYWVMPRVSKVFNCGFDNTGTHSGLTDAFNSVICDDDNTELKVSGAKFNDDINSAFRTHYHMRWIDRVKMFIKTNIIMR